MRSREWLHKGRGCYERGRQGGLCVEMGCIEICGRCKIHDGRIEANAWEEFVAARCTKDGARNADACTIVYLCCAKCWTIRRCYAVLPSSERQCRFHHAYLCVNAVLGGVPFVGGGLIIVLCLSAYSFTMMLQLTS